MSDTGDSATTARLWIEANVALFVVIVISAALLLVALLTLVMYCCCCRKKKCNCGGGGGEGGSKSTGSHLQVNMHGDSVDADSAVTANIRGPGVIEIQLEKEHHQQQQLEPGVDYPEYRVSVGTPEIVVSQAEAVGVDDVQLESDLPVQGQVETAADFPPMPPLPPLPQDVEVTAEAELRLHSRPPPEVKAEVEERHMRLPRTEVVLRTEPPSWQIQQQTQKPLRASPPAIRTAPPATAVFVTAEAAAPSFRSSHLTHEHRHGSSIYQSDDNEITIVDSDFSDYEDSPEDEARKRTSRKAAASHKFSVGAGVGIGAKAAADVGWETLPNQTVEAARSPTEEPPILAVDRNGEEYVPSPSESLGEQRMRREENLMELDRTLDVFGQQVEVDASVGMKFGGSDAEVRLAGDVDEDEILPIDRSQLPY